MPDPVTQKQFYDEINVVKDTMLAQHRGLRSALDEGFRNLNAMMDGHEREDRAVADRVLRIETERNSEKGEIAKRVVWTALVISNAITIIWKIIEHTWKP